MLLQCDFTENYFDITLDISSYHITVLMLENIIDKLINLFIDKTIKSSKTYLYIYD